MSSRIPEQLKDKTALVVGCGGLGGYVVEHLVRIGMGKIIIADHDCFCHSNLNRQLISNLENIGLSKVQEAKKRAFSINKAVQIIPIEEKVDKTNIQKIAMGCDIVFDCSDNVPTRLILEEYCEEKPATYTRRHRRLMRSVAAVYPGIGRCLNCIKIFGEKLPQCLMFPLWSPLYKSAKSQGANR